ncbi:MAG: S1C family serine protease [Alphaproteobacteria bacterium]|jgi:S1-C subfamily serine protease|nr:S1C family serine protease [Alphaproteobacteria bacterium]MDP6830219.1 S1C family serine protease [Alphaproteobacteria bacterium]MDP6875940.1 S1C family serine protease [Alphaproteobacteria bacterium]
MSDLEKVNGHHPKGLPMAFAAALSSSAEAAKLPFDVDAALNAVVELHAEIPADGYTAPFLGTERDGNGVIIDDDGLILTIGYLIVEAMAVSIRLDDGRMVPAEVVAYDYDSGFGLVRALEALGLPSLAMGRSADLAVGNGVLVAGHGGRGGAVGARVVSKREFAGYWEYMLDEAIFTSPAHPNWGGTALIGQDGKLLGIGSLYVEDAVAGEESRSGNMFVPIDLLTPILAEMLRDGRTAASHRPWMGLFTAEVEGGIEVIGLAQDGPAERAGLQLGDAIIKVNGEAIATMVGLYRKAWSTGPAGVDITMTVLRESYAFELILKSEDRYSRLKFQRQF